MRHDHSHARLLDAGDRHRVEHVASEYGSIRIHVHTPCEVQIARGAEGLKAQSASLAIRRPSSPSEASNTSTCEL